MPTETLSTPPLISKSQWQTRLEKELKSPATWESIQWHVSEYFKLDPYYDQSSSEDLSYLVEFHSFISKGRDGKKPGLLANADLLASADPQTLAQAESYGISGWVSGGAVSNPDFSFAKSPVYNRFQNETDPFMDGLANGRWGDKATTQVPHIHAADVHQAGGLAVQELAIALLVAEEWKSVFGNSTDWTNSLTLHLGVGPLFWLELGKLRAMRLLWINFCEANNWEPTMPTLRAETSKVYWSKTDTDTNLIRHTLSAMAAMMGTADQILVHPHSFEPAKALESIRLSANIGHLLMEESFLHQFADPAAGSYLVDQLTHHLAQSAWKQFGEWNEVGFTRLVEQGILQKCISQQADRLQQRYQNKEVTLLGVNQHQSEMALSSPPFPQIPMEGNSLFPQLKLLFLDA